MEDEAEAVKGLVAQAMQDYQSKIQAGQGQTAERDVTGDFSSRYSPRTNKLILDLIYDRKGLTFEGIMNNGAIFHHLPFRIYSK